MKYIKSLTINGFKKFKNFSIKFNENLNIIVGENEAGKSTILEAIRIVLSQQYRNVDKSTLKDFFNKENVEKFKKNPCISTLPKIVIELEFGLDDDVNSAYFYGENNIKQETSYGICFECKINDDLENDIEQLIEDGNIPYEYYSLVWKTFAGRIFYSLKKPLKSIFIDTTSQSSSIAFSYFNKNVFSNIYDESTRQKAKEQFRTGIDNLFEQLNLDEISENRRFGIDNKRIPLESILTIYDNSISIENHGSGLESIIKIQIALRKSDKIDVILLEEPENHLGFSMLLKVLKEINKHSQESQIILTTHNSMIASRLNLRNIIWIANYEAKTLNNVDDSDADFFVHADRNSFLQLLLSKKIILVEGATEFLLLPKFYQQLTNKTIEEDEVVIISCDGISYKRYLNIAQIANKKVAVITDNDGHVERISFAQKYNEEHYLQHIFTGKIVEERTWEVCLAKINQEKLEKIFERKDEKLLEYMLSNKVDCAYKILLSDEELEVPIYVKEAIKWINE